MKIGLVDVVQFLLGAGGVLLLLTLWCFALWRMLGSVFPAGRNDPGIRWTVTVMGESSAALFVAAAGVALINLGVLPGWGLLVVAVAMLALGLWHGGRRRGAVDER